MGMLAVGVPRSPELSKAEDQSPSLSVQAWHDLQICSVISDNWKEVKNLFSLSWERMRWAGRWQKQKRTRIVKTVLKKKKKLLEVSLFPTSRCTREVE